MPTRVLVSGMEPLGTQQEIKQRLLARCDREQDSIKITAAFLNTMHRTWVEASESEREEMMGEFAALLETDPVLKQVDEGAYDMAHRIDDAWHLSQRGHADAFDFFLRWAPRAQPVREDTSPTFEVTGQIGPPDSTNRVSMPMNLIPPVHRGGREGRSSGGQSPLRRAGLHYRSFFRSFSHAAICGCASLPPFSSGPECNPAIRRCDQALRRRLVPDK